jgi:hypothetical protein
MAGIYFPVIPLFHLANLKTTRYLAGFMAIKYSPIHPPEFAATKQFPYTEEKTKTHTYSILNHWRTGI